MKRITVFVGMILLLEASLCLAQEEELTITTYYPSPHGVYRELRLYPTLTTDVSCDATNEGAMFYDDGTDFGSPGPGVYYCDGADWQTLGGGYWAFDDTNKYLYTGDVDIVGEDWYVGIGTKTPNVKLVIDKGAISHDNNNNLYGTEAWSHINLGISSTTGLIGQNYAYCTVGGGFNNTASGPYAIVSGGINNTATALYSTVSGGYGNTVPQFYATVSGGRDNTALAFATVSGGFNNRASGLYATVSGGRGNTASESYAIVSGGYGNLASGEYSSAAGRRAKASHQGSFVWADSQNADYLSNGANTFNVRAQNGIYFQGSLGPQVLRYYDVAEFMNTEKDVDGAEIVSIIDNEKLGKSNKPYDENLIGVVSTKRTCSFYMGNPNQPSEDIKRLPISLVGPVYVRVNPESGP